MQKHGKPVIIMGAAGRDFHNFNVFFRGNKAYNVVAFTAAQIPDITDRCYPPRLSGKLYRKGIPIYDESKLTELIKKFGVKEVFLCYSDLNYTDVMRKASIVLAAGASFSLLGPEETMLESKKPVIVVCAVRTGSGKSPLSRRVVDIIKSFGLKPVVIRHPMPYGRLEKEEVERFSNFADLKRYNTTIEEREEYEPHIERGTVVYAGVDYEKILRAAEKEADVIVWDGGNNDFSFYKPDLTITVADAKRPGHEISYYPGEACARMADIVLINKVDKNTAEAAKTVKKNIKAINPSAKILFACMPFSIDGKPKGKVICIEDGPTLTHGGMNTGVAFSAARSLGLEIVDPRKHAVGSLKAIYKKFPQLGKVLPAMGYYPKQLKELEKTINSAHCDSVIVGTPINLQKLIKINKPAFRVRYWIEIQNEGVLTKEIRKVVS
ncbi:MAG: GTPase [Candidatus Aenigmarchaeota archaeon]|nr:GTPase [Candidatus Aenigmarchaeota archaeon]